MHIESQSRPDHRTSAARLWFGFAGGAVAWATHGLLSVVISAQSCEDGTGDLGVLPAVSVRLLMAGITLALLGVAACAGLTSFRNWKRLSDEREVLHAEATGREQFMALGGVFVSVIFVAGILWAGLPLILLDICTKGR